MINRHDDMTLTLQRKGTNLDEIWILPHRSIRKKVTMHSSLIDKVVCGWCFWEHDWISTTTRSFSWTKQRYILVLTTSYADLLSVSQALRRDGIALYSSWSTIHCCHRMNQISLGVSLRCEQRADIYWWTISLQRHSLKRNWRSTHGAVFMCRWTFRTEINEFNAFVVHTPQREMV